MKVSVPSLFFNLIVLFLFFLSILPRPSFAVTYFDTPIPSGQDYQVVSNSFCSGPDRCANTYTTSTANSACGLNGCGSGLTWTKYELTCVYRPSLLDYDEYYNPIPGERVYSIGDKCISGETGLRPGFCDGNYGATYKRCCSDYTPVVCTLAPSILQDGIYPDEGACPPGTTETAPGVTSCPTAPVTCSLSSRTPNPYTQCGGTCNGITYPSNHTIEVTESTCTDNTTQYSCSDLGVLAGQCGNPSTPPPSCNISSWTFSPSSTPQANSTVSVTVQGTTTSNWNGASYSLDGGNWTPAGSGPPFNFNINSGSAGIHTLRFAISNGSTVCQNSSSFTTDYPPQNNAATCTSLTFNSPNIVASQNYTATVTMRNDGDTTWSGLDSFPYRLGAQQPQDDPNWGTSSGADSGKGMRPTRVNLSSQVPPGSSATFTFGVSAPDTAGTYRFSWQMVNDSPPPVGEWFGGMCQPNITVQAPIFTFTPSCSGTVTNAATRTIRWDATVNPATPPTGSYTYLWSVDASGTTQSVTQTYGTTGTKNATVTVSNSGISQTANCSATIPDPFLYNLTNNGDRSVIQGASTTNTITANLGSGTTQLVNLSVSPCPSGVTCSLSPTSGNPTYSSTLTMTASPTATTGTFLITVTGTSLGLSNRTSTFNLTVNPTGTPAAPTVSTSSLSCINSGYTGNGVAISWTNSGVSWVNISTDSTFGSYYHKSVTGFSTTAPNGFNLNPSTPPQPLTLNPNTTYYVRTWNNTQHSAVASFSIPACGAPGGPICGNNTCESGVGETSLTCPTDCPISGGPVCTNNICEATEKTSSSCPQDCPTGGPICGNGKCEGGEPTSCPLDCPTVPNTPSCGNSRCEAGEPLSCLADCPGVPACSGTINLTLTPNPVSPSGSVSATASGLNSCTGIPVTVTPPTGPPLSCTSGSTGCTTPPFSAPASPGNFPVTGCVDLNNNGNCTDPGESTTTPLTVNPTSSSSNCAWIQTFGGDVHSNTLINTLCGP